MGLTLSTPGLIASKNKDDFFSVSDLDNPTEDTPWISSIFRLLLASDCNSWETGLCGGQPGPDQPQLRGEVFGEAAGHHPPQHRPCDGGEEGQGDQNGEHGKAVAPTLHDVQLHQMV